MYSIEILFEENSKKPVRLEKVMADESILDVALDYGVDLHHNCGGVCACSTCHIYVEKGEEFLEPISDKEEDFVDRARNPKLNSRLACQSVLLPGKSGHVTITIPDQSIIQGE